MVVLAAAGLATWVVLNRNKVASVMQRIGGGRAWGRTPMDLKQHMLRQRRAWPSRTIEEGMTMQKVRQHMHFDMKQKHCGTETKQGYFPTRQG